MGDSEDPWSLKSRSAAVVARAIVPKINACFIKETTSFDYATFIDAVKCAIDNFPLQPPEAVSFPFRHTSTLYSI
jgi:hypothetical protein